MIKRRESGHLLQHVRNRLAGKTVIDASSGSLCNNQTRIDQLLQVDAGGLRADLDTGGQLLAGISLSVHHCAEHTRPTGVAQGSSDKVEFGFQSHDLKTTTQ